MGSRRERLGGGKRQALSGKLKHNKSKPTAASGSVSWVQRYPKTTLVIVTLVCLLPFAGKAFHIDDPLFVWAGRQMQTRWWDPFGFQVNWYGWDMPMHEVTMNPPMACAFIAVIIAMFGEHELPLHIAFSIQAIAVILGTYALARRFCERRVLAAFAALFTPVFMVSSTTLMCDVLMLALWVWAVVFWMQGLENNRPLLLVLAGFLIGACVLAKYFGIALIPLLLVYSLMRNRRPGWWLAYFLIPLAIIASYEVAMRALYGHGLILSAFSYTHENQAHGISEILVKFLTVTGFIGGCCAIGLIFAPMLWRARPWIAAAILSPFLLLTTWILSASLPASTVVLPHLVITLLWTLLILSGVSVLALPILEWRRDKSAETLMLLLWVWGTFAFCILNWTVNGRSVLPMAPAVAILVLRRIEFVGKSTLQLSSAFGVAAALSLLLSFADYRLANSARAATEQVKTEIGDYSSPVWFQGHWGFQYYAQASGLRIFDSKNPQVRPGDLLVTPPIGSNLTTFPSSIIEPLGVIELPVAPGIATISDALGAGFYSDSNGPLPFSIGAVPSEKYYVVRFKAAPAALVKPER